MKRRLTMFLAGLTLFVGGAFAQTQITGTVFSEEDNEPLIGAKVSVVGTQSVTVTDNNGRFSIMVPKGYKNLTVSYVGMLPKSVSARDGVEIYLQDNSRALDEVMVVAYGTTKRSTFTGSAMEVKSEDITNHVSSSATNSLIGKVAGVQATGVSAGPGSSPTIRIRGFGSMEASTTPLYILDGVPMIADVVTINPNDIESISVLKDASATALYGSRAANGAVIITTKKARGKQDAEVTFDAKWGSNSRLIPNYDVITDPGQYYETQFASLYNWRKNIGYSDQDAYKWANNNLYNSANGGLGYQVYTVPEGQNLIGRNGRLNPKATLGYSDGEYYYTPDNWYDETFHNSFRQEYNVSVSGGTDRLSYYAGVGFLQDGGTVENSSYKRYTARTNIEYKAKKWLRLTTNMGFTHRDSQEPAYGTTWGSSGNLFYITNNMGPIYPLYVRNADGSIKVENGMTVYDYNQTNQSRPSIVGNAVRDNMYDRYQGYADLFNGQWQATLIPVEGLEIWAQLAATNYNSRSTELYSRFGSGMSYDGIGAVSSSRTMNVNQQYMANWRKNFGDHNINILVGYENNREISQSLSGDKDHLFNPYVGELNNALSHTNEHVNSYTDHIMRQGILGRASYDYAERYFVDASIRRDGSSIFAPGHRWGTFGGVGLGWQMNNEEFLKDAKWIDLLKLKASFGANGNDGGMGWHAYADSYTTTYNDETKEYSISQTGKGNENLTWEKKHMWNFGVDFSFFKYRLNGTIEFYTGRTKDLLYTKDLPLSSGIGARTYPTNVGELLNRGIELSLDGDVIKTKNIRWNLNLSLAHNHNEFLSLDPADELAGGIKYSNSIIRVGGSLYEAYMLKYAGTYQGSYTGEVPENNNFQPGQALWYARELDANGNETGNDIVVNSIDQADQYDLGSIIPKVIGGFGTTFEAYGVDVNAQFSFQLGGKTVDGAYQALMQNGRAQGQAMHKDLLSAWSTENTGSDIPRLSYGDTDASSQTASDRWLTKSNYLSLNNLTVGYTFPANWTRKLQIRSLRVFFAGENLFLLTARKGLDPRYTVGVGSFTTGAGMATSSYATMRSITAGLTVKF
ncbi:MAG: TonB-dependent receptor [Bacteroidaceae bacterium]|nr:TonB-dependent receptor [Bacteroidaceae bacterium]